MRYLFVILITLSMITAPAMASEISLRFKDSTTDIRELEVLDMLKTELQFDKSFPFGIARIDLNDDGVNEWVIRDYADGCEASVSCRFVVVGLSMKKPIILAQFYAGNLKVLDKKMFGVHGFAVYNNPNDDFTYTTHHWNPRISAYSTNY